MKLVLRPCYLGGIMKESGNRPPMMVPSKGLYMNKDLIRNANYYQVPLKLMEVQNNYFHILLIHKKEDNKNLTFWYISLEGSFYCYG